MNKIFLSFSLLLISFGLSAREWVPKEWPSLKHYDSAHLYQVALPLGGIGTGTVSLGGRGELRDWEIMNVPGKGYSTVTTGNNAPFFAIYTKEQGKEPQTTLLAGPLYDVEYLHYEGRSANHHGMPRFSHASFDAAYPFGQVNLSDESLPVKVRIKAFNPLVPANADDSGMPVAVLTYEVENLTSAPLEAAVCGSARNFVGKDGSLFRTNWKGDYIPQGAKQNRNVFRQEDNISGIYMYSEGVEKDSPAFGTIAITTEAVDGVSYRTSSRAELWYTSILDFWDDFSEDGSLTEKTEIADEDPMASLSVKKTIPANGKETFTFFITWSFPNRVAWAKENQIIGNYYTAQYPDAWDAAKQIIPQIPALEQQTLTFVEALLGSDYPEVMKEAALFNLSTLRSQTVFRIPSGHMMGWEGVMDRFGSCRGSCTHVWNYEVATPFLYGELSKTMRDVEFNYATKENGLMNFRAELPLSTAADRSRPAADGQMGCIMKFYRDWQLSGDNDFLKDNWEQVKKVLSFAWTERGWDGNQDGVMEGEQHNTMDVEYYGPNPQMGFWYLGALQAAARMADAMNDKAFAEKCRLLFDKGSRWMDENLFNGEYYEHKITDPETFEFIDVERNPERIPEFQLGPGCLVDQLVGQYMAHICDLGYLGRKENMKTTLQSIMKYNYKEGFRRHFNNMRSYVFGDESGLLMASWPKGRLKIPFPYFAEVMTGFEYCAAVGMLYEGMEEEALKCIAAVRERHEGSKRNPFSEPECGHHYARAMASWAALIAWSDFHYSGVEQTMHFGERQGTWFWSNGYAWGVCKVEKDRAVLEVLYGDVAIKTFSLGDRSKEIENGKLTKGDVLEVEFSPEAVPYEHIMTVDRFYPNDGDCYDGILFQFHSQNYKPEADCNGCSVIDLEKREVIQFIELGFDQNFHNSSITFTKQRYSRKDRFPLLYASENYAPNDYYKVIVYRVIETGDPKAPFALDIVQTINMPDPDKNGTLYPHCFYDNEGDCLWIEAYSSDKKENVYTRYALPKFRKNTVADMGEPLETFRLPRDPKTDQAIFKRGNRMYQVVGYHKCGKLRVIDLETKTLYKNVDLTSLGLEHEPEAVYFHKGDMYITFFQEGKTAIYKISPEVYE